MQAITNMFGFLAGKKSYAAGAASIAYGVLAFLMGEGTMQGDLGFVLGGLSVIFVRLGVKKAEDMQVFLLAHLSDIHEKLFTEEVAKYPE